MPEEPILLDAQLLVLLAVGLTDRKIIPKHKKTRQFLIEDFDLLLRLIGNSPILLTPNTVTEASNHLMWHTPPERDRIVRTLQRLTAACREDYVPSAEASVRPEYIRLGVTDAAILLRAQASAAILTADAGLYVAAEAAHLSVTNFNHRREAEGLL